MKLWSHFASGLDPTKLASQLGMDCDPWQARMLRSNAPRVHVNCSRQAGKSTTASIASLAKAMYSPRSLVLIVSPTQRQSSELFKQVLGRYRQLGKPIDSESENQLSLTLENGSRIISVPGTESGIRGFTVDLLVIDEASRVSDELWTSLSPMLAVSNGRVIAMSTPAGRRGWWYLASDSKQWECYRVPATEVPRISPERLADERKAMGERAFNQEYMCSFEDAAGAAFLSQDIDAIFNGIAASRAAVPTATLPRSRMDREIARVIRQGPRFGAHDERCRHGVTGRCFKCVANQARSAR